MTYAWVEVHAIEVLSISVSAMHMHVLARFGTVPGQKHTPPRGGLREKDPARYFMAIAKERSAKSLAASGLVEPGGVWAKRGKIFPIKDRSHQLNVYRYILNHATESAAVWSFKGGHNHPQKKPTPSRGGLRMICLMSKVLCQRLHRVGDAFGVDAVVAHLFP